MLDRLVVFWEWLGTVIEHWELIVVSGAIPFAIELIDRLLDKKMPKKWYAIFVSIGLALAMFASWREQRDKNVASASYVELRPKEPYYSPDYFLPNLPLAWNVQAVVPSTNGAMYPFFGTGAYLGKPDDPVEEQRIIAAFKEKWEKEAPEADIKTWNKNGHSWFQTTTVNPPDWTSAKGPVLKQEDVDALTPGTPTTGTETVYIVAAARFVDSMGFHDAHGCYWLEPPPQQKAPHVRFKSGGPVWHLCVGFNAPVDVK
jgi:hypothetical protein